MSIAHHPSAGMLASYASGAMGEGPGLLIASHLTLCPDCRQMVADFDRVGGAMLEEMTPEPISVSGFDAIMALLDETEKSGPRTDSLTSTDPASTVASDPPPVRMEDLNQLPQDMRQFPKALRDRLLAGGAPQWRYLAPGVKQIKLDALSDGGEPIRLFKLQPGTPMPQHDHSGTEMTLVLKGSFSDQAGRYRRGDVAEADEGVVHAPVVDDDEECICLVVTEGPLRYTGMMGRIMQSITGI